MGICRTEDFLKMVTDTDTPQGVIDLEVTYLRNSYNVLSSLKRAFTTYRVACQSLDENLLTLCKKDFRLSFEETKKFNSDYDKQVATENRNLRPFNNIDGFLYKAKQLLNNPNSYYDLILGLCALTGRRSAEIACTAEFTKVDDSTLLFTGQLKTKGRTDIKPYQIPVLTNTDNILLALEELRSRKPDLLDQPILFHDRATKALSQRVKKHFGTHLEGIKTKDLRAIYGDICYYLLNDHTKGKNRYLSDILGHYESDNKTGASYVDFYIDDELYS